MEDQIFEDDEVKKIYKCECGCKIFYVGWDLYYTAIKCLDCGKEMCVHEG